MTAKLKPIEVDDITKYIIPSNLKYSPDGRYLAFQTSSADVEKNSYHTDVYVEKDGESKRVTWSMDASIVMWDDDETLVLKRTVPDAAPGVTDLFKLNMSGGEAYPWITLPFGLSSLHQAGEGRYIAIGAISVSDPDAYKDDDNTRKKKAEEKKQESDYQVVDEVPYWFNGAGFTNGIRQAMFLIDINGELSVKRLTGKFFSVGSVKVSGSKVYYTGNNQRNLMSLDDKIYCYDLEKKRVNLLFGKKGYSAGGLFVIGHDLYASVCDRKAYGVNQTPDICRIENKEAVKVYVPEVSLYSSVIGDTAEGGEGDYCDGRSFITVATVDSHNALFELTPSNDGPMDKVTLWEEKGMVCSMTACDNEIAVIYQGWNDIAEVYVMDRNGRNMKKVSHLNDAMLDGRYVARPMSIEYSSCGYDLTGWVLLPQDFSPNRKYPAVLDVHGGPRCAYGETFFHEMQLWVAKGYVVFFTNIKGSDGRGDAFADIRNDYGGTDFNNLMDFTDAVLEAYPNIDRDRLCVTGGSYGGFMTNWIIGHTDRFCCAASQRSISNWISMGFISDIGGMFAPDQNGASGMFGDENTKLLWDHSPLKYADKVRTPTLFIHSDEDYRCPLPEGMQMMQAIVDNGVEARMCIFHGENHELSRSGKPKHRIRRLNEITDWFEKHTK